MPHFLWDPDLETGITELDYQHRRLFRYVNILLEAIRNGHTRTALAGFLVFIRKHIAEHFEYEESLMGAFNYAGLREHKEAHEDLRKSVEELSTEFKEKGNDPLVLIRLSILLYDWLRKHIFGTDFAFTSWYKNNCINRG